MPSDTKGGGEGGGAFHRKCHIVTTGPRSEDTRARGPKQCYLAYKERTKADSTSFAGVKRLFDAFARNGCVIEDIPHSFGEDVRFHKVMVEDSE
jgi:hypothetical protein